jgi:hypothetical protein
MYFRMETDSRQLTTFVVKDAGPALYNLVEGAWYRVDDEWLPYKFTYHDPSGDLPIDYISGNCLMSNRLIAALRLAGVDNLQVFSAELKDRDSGTINKDYSVVNIIGIVEAADLTNSESLPLGDKKIFTKLKLDDQKARNLVIFRLAESLIDVIVHEKVVDVVNKTEEIRGILFSEV